MKFKVLLKSQLNDFVDVYDRFFYKTVNITLVYTIFCFIIIALLSKFSSFDITLTKKQISILSFFFSRYSKNDVYSIVDLSKTIFLFFVSLYSIGLTRLTSRNSDQQNFRLLGFIKNLKPDDLFDLIIVLILCSIIDLGLYKLDYLSLIKTSNKTLDTYFHYFIFLFRIYIPLILFSLTIYRLVSNSKLNMNFQKFLFLFITLWIFNEFAYEFSILIRNYIFGTILLPFNNAVYYLFESIFGIFLIAFYFIGYHSAMTTPLKLFETRND